MSKEIGSDFWISPGDSENFRELGTPAQFGCNGSDYVWMSTGRSATRLVLDIIEERNPCINKIALIPPFTCYTVIEPFIERGYTIYSLHISDRLETLSSEIVEQQQATGASVILVHRYYGFDTLPCFDSVVCKLRGKGVIIIEDCTQSLYSSYERSDADYFVGSIRKWCGVPNGGFAVCRNGIFNYKPTLQDTKQENLRKIASEMKYQYIAKSFGEKSVFQVQYRTAEYLLDNQTGYFTIGDLSSRIQSNLDINELTEKRRSNYCSLAEGLQKVKGMEIIFKILPNDVVPLYFPLLVEDRKHVQDLLANNNVYAPVVWPKADCCPIICELVEDIYKHILCIPIDQRYSTSDMKKIVKILTDI